MTTKAEALEGLGRNKFEDLKDGLTGQDTDDILQEQGIAKCDACKSWEDGYLSGGNGEGIICEHCYTNSLKPVAVEARQIYRELNNEEIEEPVSKNQKGIA